MQTLQHSQHSAKQPRRQTKQDITGRFGRTFSFLCRLHLTNIWVKLWYNTSMSERKKITIGILAHVDAGKTTLSEAILYKCGAIRKAGRVDHGDALLDSDSQEK